MVLSGAVLTSFVGVTGLVHRMTLDRCLPQFLLKTNKRGTTHRIIIAFFLLSVSVLFITHRHVPENMASEMLAATSDIEAPDKLTKDATLEEIRAYKEEAKETGALLATAVSSIGSLSDYDKTLITGMEPVEQVKILRVKPEKGETKEQALSKKLHGVGESAQIKKLAGIYTISFLAVMALFGFGNVPAESKTQEPASSGKGVLDCRVHRNHGCARWTGWQCDAGSVLSDYLPAILYTDVDCCWDHAVPYRPVESFTGHAAQYDVVRCWTDDKSFRLGSRQDVKRSILSRSYSLHAATTFRT